MQKTITVGNVIFLFLAILHLTTVATSAQSNEVERFEALKQKQIGFQKKAERNKALSYVTTVTTQARKRWTDYKTAANGQPLVTKVVFTAVPQKITDFRILHHSGSTEEDECVHKFVSLLHVPSLPAGMTNLRFYWTFISDGSLNVLESTESRQADEYNLSTIGGTLSPTSSYQQGPNHYINELERRINRAWHPPKGSEYERVVLLFDISRGGELSNLILAHSSKVAAADAAALNAVKNAAPFGPLPHDGTKKVTIQFIFDYRLYPSGVHGAVQSF